MRKLILCLAMFLCLGAASAAFAGTETADEAFALDTQTTEQSVRTDAMMTVTDVQPADAMALVVEAAAIGGECGFPRPTPPTSCVCGSCCECNRCWRYGATLQKCLDGP
jgi:hypothetical protein